MRGGTVDVEGRPWKAGQRGQWSGRVCVAYGRRFLLLLCRLPSVLKFFVFCFFGLSRTLAGHCTAPLLCPV